MHLTSICTVAMLFLFPLASRALDLTEQDTGRSVSIVVGGTVSITLAGNPTTGYTWELADIDRAVLAPDPEPAFTADSSLTGAGGKFTFGFLALKTGSSAVKLSYRRPWEKDIPPLRSVELTLTVLPPEPRVMVACYRSGDGKTAMASFDLGRDLVTVILPDGRSVTLPTAPSASGARYSDGKETFWEHQGSARFFNGETLVFEGALQDTVCAGCCTRQAAGLPVN